MPQFTNNQSLLDRCRVLLKKVYYVGRENKFSGQFGHEFMSRLEIKQLLNEKGACDFRRYGLDVKTTTRGSNGAITLFELACGDDFQWTTDAKRFLRKYGTAELGDGRIRHDRRLDAEIDAKWLNLSYEGCPLIRVKTDYILNRFRIKLLRIALVEGEKVGPGLIKPFRITIVENPPFTLGRISEMLKHKTLVIESRMKMPLDGSKLVHRFIYKITAKNMKTMTQDTKTPVQLTSSTPASEISVPLNDAVEVLSSTIPDGFSIEFIGPSQLEANVEVNGEITHNTWTLEMVTPAKAQDFLYKLDHDKQRKVRRGKVRSLKMSFDKDRIALTGDSIIFENGKMIQGQHRCNAIVESGKTVPCLIMRTNNNKLYDLIDDVLPRGFPDRVSKAEEYSQAIGAAINFVRRYDQGAEGKRGLTFWGGDVLHCKSDQKAYWMEHIESLREAVRVAIKCKRILFPPSVGTAFLELAWRKKSDKKSAEAYIDKLITGIDMKGGTPVHTLRSWLERENADSSKRCRPEMIFAQIVLAWNYQQTDTKYVAPRKPKMGVRLSREDRRFPRFYWEKPLPTTKAAKKEKIRA